MHTPVGNSSRFQEVLQEVHAVASAQCAVLIHGETGTGKEVIARCVHDYSLRRNGPFVALNCAALPAALLESELFGHERGAFTGAVTQTTGRFLAANGGTLFLDEVGDMPLELQPKLLRVLQEQTFERLGSTRSIHADVRIVAATNQDLSQMVEDGRFRADLFYRLSVFPIQLPALRDRAEDIEALCHHFLKRVAAEAGKHDLVIPRELLEVMERYHWPGNIRELQNFIERAVIVSNGSVLTPRAVEMQKLQQCSQAGAKHTLLGVEREYILQILEKTSWIIGGPRGAAARLGVPRTTLISKMQRLGIERSPDVAFDRMALSGGARLNSSFA